LNAAPSFNAVVTRIKQIVSEISDISPVILSIRSREAMTALTLGEFLEGRPNIVVKFHEK
ncbi:MAG: hypothetical protein WCF85_19595, partial [Rhodospirillaceae bacterium]